MSGLYLSFYISEGIADRGEVDYATWHRWIAEDYVYGPYDAIVCVYGTIEGYDRETGDRETLAHLVDRPGDRYDGYWRVVKREVYERFVFDFGRPQFDFLVRQPLAYACPDDERLPPFSDWSVDVVADASVRRVREVEAYRPRPGQIGWT